MKSLWFVVPVHGRLELAAICLRQLRRTCDALLKHDIRASAVVVSSRDALEQLGNLELGFATVVSDNVASRRFNDGIQVATDPRLNPDPADYVVPCGSDDWVDHRLFIEPLPGPDTIAGFKWMSFVNEDASEISSTYVDYDGGCGIRIIPRQLVAPLSYRPAAEDLRRGCDTSILVNIRRHHAARFCVQHYETPAHWIVDWKTDGQQLNCYRDVTRLHRSTFQSDPFSVLADSYPAEALEEMKLHYDRDEVCA